MAYLPKRFFSSTIRTMHLAKSWGDPAPLMNTLKAIEAPQLQSVLTKARGPWKELTNQEMVKLYRENFPKTILEGKQATPGETRKVLFGTGLCIVIGIVVASFLRETVGPTKPHTYNNPDWDAAKRERLIQQKSNPITGISSKLDVVLHIIYESEILPLKELVDDM